MPNGLHYKWTLAALKAGKHVLLEKPSVSNAQEARSLFHHQVLKAPNAPVLVEASHYRFHPAWYVFLTQFEKANVEKASVRAGAFKGAFPETDIRYDYDLAGGAAMDIGHYTLSALRGVFGAEPTDVTSATPSFFHPTQHQLCDRAMDATYTFPNGGSGHVLSDLGARGGYWFPWLTSNWPNFSDLLASISVTLRPENLETTNNGLHKSSQKSLMFWGFMGPHSYHRIDITTTTTLRDPSSGKIVKEEKKTEYKKAYKWPEGMGGEKKGEDWWVTYRYMLEEFVNKVKRRDGSGAWVDGEESIKQMEATDRTYERAGMLVRPTSKEME